MPGSQQEQKVGAVRRGHRWPCWGTTLRGGCTHRPRSALRRSPGCQAVAGLSEGGSVKPHPQQEFTHSGGAGKRVRGDQCSSRSDCPRPCLTEAERENPQGQAGYPECVSFKRIYLSFQLSFKDAPELIASGHR